MSATDTAFSQGVEGGEDDPFAGTDISEFREVPVETDPTTAAATSTQEATGTTGAGDGEAPVASEDEEAELAAAVAAAEEAGIEVDGVTLARAEPDPTTAGDPASSATPKSQSETQPSPAAADANAPATSPGDAGPTSASATSETPASTAASSEAPGAEAGAEQAPPPQEKKDKKGATTARGYYLFKPGEKDGTFEEITWFEKDGKRVKASTAGAKKQNMVLASGQEQALAFGFAVLGSPQEGALLIAVAGHYWRVVPVAPDEVQPVRQRLKFG